MLATTCGKLGFPFLEFQNGQKSTGAGWSGTFYTSTFPRISTLLKDINNFIMFSKITPFKIIPNQSLSRQTLCWHCHSLDLNSTCRCAYNKLTSTNQLTIYWPKSQKHVLPHPKKNTQQKTFMSSLSPFFGFPLNSPFKKTLKPIPSADVPNPPAPRVSVEEGSKPAKSNLRVYPFLPVTLAGGRLNFRGITLYTKKLWYWYFGILFKFNFSNSNNNSNNNNNNNNNKEEEEEVHRPKRTPWISYLQNNIWQSHTRFPGSPKFSSQGCRGVLW